MSAKASGKSVTVLCPSWHFLPGPHQDSNERRNCPYVNTHKAQREAWDRQKSGGTAREVHRWTDSEGVPWECDAYDHGPFCRLCRRVEADPS